MIIPWSSHASAVGVYQELCQCQAPAVEGGLEESLVPGPAGEGGLEESLAPEPGWLGQQGPQSIGQELVEEKPWELVERPVGLVVQRRPHTD